MTAALSVGEHDDVEYVNDDILQLFLVVQLGCSNDIISWSY